MELDADFSRFFREQLRHVRQFLRHRHLESHQVDDLAQEVFLRAYRAFPNFEKRGIAAAEAAWVSKIALRTWYNWYRDHRTENLLATEVGDEEQPFDPPDPHAVDSSRRLIENELLAAIPGLLNLMPAGQREVLRWWLQGKTYEEICEQTGKSLQNVRATLHKAKAKLSDSLRQLDHPPPRGGEDR